ncbi:MAG: transglycosylase domain-containing protein, partial [Deltaproteobacteria bacterium]|nr:transglycosylase domain-containing protein [Deltaproteobacteria bacterium]
FNKPASELDDLESAFIAGSVKRPNYYNPFIQENQEMAALAMERAKQRAGYVLRQMLKLRMISSSQYEKYMQRDIAFEQGKMFFPLNTLMDFVKSGLSLPEVEEALAAHGIDNISTSGIKIFTTVDKDLQERAFYGLRKELSRLSIRLNGYVHEEVQEFYGTLTKAGDLDLHETGFLMGRISAVDISDEPSITVSLGKLGGKQNLTGTIDRSGILPVIDSLVKWEKQRWTQSQPDDLKRFLEGLNVGDRIFVSVREIDRINNTILLDLEKYPRIQGGVVALKDGVIHAMVGGMENHFYNRAVAAKRPMGSVIKPLVYTAALQLGWNSIDALDNERNLFVYQKQAYFPRPDHESPHKQVSMNWAGVHSENVATVWLLYHLCDQLIPAQFKELISHLDLDRREYESHAGYRRRLRDTLGILIDKEQLYRAAFRQAVINLEPDMIFSGKLEEYRYLKKMHYGADFADFRKELRFLEGAAYDSTTRRQFDARKERKIREQILRNNYLEHMALLREIEFLRNSLFGQQATGYDQISPNLLGSFYLDMKTDHIIYATKPDEEGFWQPLGPADIRKRLHPLSLARFRENFQNDFWDNIFIEGRVSCSTMKILNKYVQTEYEQLASLPPYSFEVLSRIPDFRVLAGLRYVTALGKALNIRSQLEPVLSFPLGSNVISLLEAAWAYQAITIGHVTRSGTDDSRDELAIIDHIENADGETIFVPGKKNIRVVDARTNLMICDILRNIVKFGTGRYADKNIRLHSFDPEVEQQLRQFNMPVPVIGKTGTANRFTNSAFAGVIPGPHEDKTGFAVQNGYTLTAYVGFDNNDPMVRRSTHITGSSGALPVWTRMANDILIEKDFGDQLDLVDLAFSVDPLTGESGLRLIQPDLEQKSIIVDSGNGLPLDKLNNEGATDSPEGKVLTFGTLLPSGELEPVRSFQPFWSN